MKTKMNVSLDYVQNDNKVYHSDCGWNECKVRHFAFAFESVTSYRFIEEKDFDNMIEALNYIRNTNIRKSDMFIMTYLKSNVETSPIQIIAYASDDDCNLEIMGEYQFLIEVILSNLNDSIRRFLFDKDLKLEAYLSPRPIFILKDREGNIVFSSIRDHDMSKMCPEVLYMYVQFHSMLGMDFASQQMAVQLINRDKKAED